MADRRAAQTAMIAALQGATPAGDSVFGADVESHHETPWIGVAVASDDRENLFDVMVNTVEMEVAIRDALTDGVEDALDATAAPVEIALAAMSSGVIDDLRYLGADYNLDDEGGHDVGVLTLRYQVTIGDAAPPRPPGHELLDPENPVED